MKYIFYSISLFFLQTKYKDNIRSFDGYNTLKYYSIRYNIQGYHILYI